MDRHACWHLLDRLGQWTGVFQCRAQGCGFLGDLSAAVEHAVHNQYEVKEA